jgi:hypothetical protein
LVDGAGRDLVQRADNVWSTGGIARRAVSALERAGRPVPAYVRWVVEETAPEREHARFAMACYWSGEACLGAIDGVLSTQTAHAQGREVVEVTFDAARITRAELEARAQRCGVSVEGTAAARAASDRDQKYYLQGSIWRHLPLTELQRTRVNAALGQGRSPLPWVSPRQAAIHRALVADPDAWKSAPAGGSGAPGALGRYDAALRNRLGM